jgi:hypothetical protein
MNSASDLRNSLYTGTCSTQLPSKKFQAVFSLKYWHLVLTFQFVKDVFFKTGAYFFGITLLFIYFVAGDEPTPLA